MHPLSRLTTLQFQVQAAPAWLGGMTSPPCAPALNASSSVKSRRGNINAHPKRQKLREALALEGQTCLGAGDRLDVGFLALLADCATAARVVSAPPQGPSVEPVLELLAVLRFPGLDGQSVLLLDLVPVPFWNHVEGAEGHDPQAGGEVVEVAALEPLLVLTALGMTGRLETALETDNRDAYEPTVPAPQHHSPLRLDGIVGFARLANRDVKDIALSVVFDFPAPRASALSFPHYVTFDSLQIGSEVICYYSIPRTFFAKHDDVRWDSMRKWARQASTAKKLGLNDVNSQRPEIRLRITRKLPR